MVAKGPSQGGSQGLGPAGPAAAAALRVQAAIRAALEGLVEREVLVQVVALAAIAEEHVLVIGEPGTAKSEAVRRIARALGGRTFEYLLGRFTEPSELFGPIDLVALQQGRLETVTTGMLPEADLAFLDEVFLGSTAILNALLGILNERQFRRGATSLSVPLKLCVGASNALPEEPSLAAFADRFLARVFVAPVPDTALEALLGAGSGGAVRAVASMDDLAQLTAARRRVELDGVRPALAEGVRRLRRAGIALTDRRIVRAQNLVAAAAALDGRTRAGAADLWPLLYAIPTREEQEAARGVLGGLLAHAESPLAAAALAASASAAARAGRLAEQIEAFLAQGEAPSPSGGAGAEGAEALAQRGVERGLRAEGFLRDLDASFPREQLPAPLPALRERLTALATAGRAAPGEGAPA